jgi:hypothetical protein
MWLNVIYLTYNSLVEASLLYLNRCILQDFQIAGTSLELQLLLICGDIYNTIGERPMA